MQHVSAVVANNDDIVSFLNATETAAAVAGAHSVLAQIYAGVDDRLWLRQLASAVAAASDKIVVVGATTFGEIDKGKALSNSTVISLICFDTVDLLPVTVPCRAGEERAVAGQVAHTFQDASQPVRGLLLLATTLPINGTELLTHLREYAPDVPVFGGGAGDNGHHEQTFVFAADGDVFDSGVVAVALCGHSLELLRRNYLGWERMNKPMRVTSVNEFGIRTINNRPAFEMYRYYLGIEADDRFFFNAMEFPFLVERDGVIVARVPYAVDADNAISFAAEVKQGESIDFGYAHIDSILNNVSDTLQDMQAFQPEVIGVYSCGVRHFVLQQNVSLELAPFEAIAPIVGFFTYGEFYSFETHNALLNSSLVLIGMRESSVPNEPNDSEQDRLPADIMDDIYAPNHIRVLSRFQHFMQVLNHELKLANDKLAQLADRDYLTGLYNRRKLEARLQEEVERGQRHGHPCCVVFTDIDKFKSLNDTYGHSAGDEVLKRLAQLITHGARTSDVLTRYGGEEFVLLLPDTGIEAAVDFAERMRRRIADMELHFQGRMLPTVTVSFGVAAYPDHAQTANDLLQAADHALYRAKRTGRNRVCIAE